MSDQKPGEREDAQPVDPRTVIAPGPAATGGEERTVVAPAGPLPAGDERTVVAPQAGPVVHPTSNTTGSFAPRTDGQGIQIGDVLNHIFEVKRFIARGGMGEVFEGVNVNTDEPVAIKVMLPALAADPNVIALFRKEARTLTKLNHDALVKYRVLAQEPQLGVLYIVTEYIDGKNLSDMLGKISPDEREVTGLLRCIASGLAVAHSYGAIHRDISPDNVLLEGGRLDKPKVIDFGIAKDLDPGSKTIVGEGFAGKLSYVAPEQLGDFGRNVGPWTDVYSLALVILAVIQGRNVQMGGSLVDAVDKRRAGPDLSAVPDRLRPVLEAMLKPDPKDRLQSMEAVLAMLDGAGASAPPPAGAVAAVPGRSISKPALVGAVAAGLAILGIGGFLATRGGTPDAGRGGNGATGNPVELATSTINSTLPNVDCSWLDIGQVQAASGGGVAVAMRGVAGNPDAARAQIERALQGAGVAQPAVDFANVAPITPAGCAALNTYRLVRASDAGKLSVDAQKFEMRRDGDAKYSRGVLKVAIGDPATDFAIAGIEPSGVISPLIENRAMFAETLKSSSNGEPIRDLGNDSYAVTNYLDHEGWSGYLLLTGKGPFERELVQPPLGARGPDWQERFATAAAERGWTSEMVWIKSVDENPD